MFTASFGVEWGPGTADRRQGPSTLDVLLRSSIGRQLVTFR